MASESSEKKRDREDAAEEEQQGELEGTVVMMTSRREDHDLLLRVSFHGGIRSFNLSRYLASANPLILCVKAEMKAIVIVIEHLLKRHSTQQSVIHAKKTSHETQSPLKEVRCETLPTQPNEIAQISRLKVSSRVTSNIF